VIPVFGEIREYLQIQLNELLQEFDPKVSRLSEQPVIRTLRNRNNIRTQLARYVRRCGIPVWKKLYQNCRVSRKNELRDMGFDRDTICQWLGHDPRTAFKYYHEPTSTETARAANLPKPMPSAAQLMETTPNGDKELCNNSEEKEQEKLTPGSLNGRHWTRNYARFVGENANFDPSGAKSGASGATTARLGVRCTAMAGPAPSLATHHRGHGPQGGRARRGRYNLRQKPIDVPPP
jgi:hypothetical protein